jgi:hypothetical protein
MFIHEQGELEKYHIAWRVYISANTRTGYSGASISFDGTSTKYQYRHIYHASISFDSQSREFDISDILEGSTAPEIAAYLVRLCFDVMRRQVYLMVYCGLAGITYPHRYNMIGIDNENSNPAALREFERFRQISDMLEDMVSCVIELEINGVDVSTCLLAAATALRRGSEPRPFLEMPDAEALAIARQRSLLIPSQTHLDKKPYVPLLNTKRRVEYHDSFPATYSVFVRLVRAALVSASRLQGLPENVLLAHVEVWEGRSFQIGPTLKFVWRADLRQGGFSDIVVVRGALLISRHRYVDLLPGRCGDHILNINAVGNFREIGRLLGGEKVSKKTRIPMYTFLKSLSRRIDGGNFRDKFAGLFFVQWGSMLRFGRVTENRFFSFDKATLRDFRKPPYNNNNYYYYYYYY